MRDVLRRHRLVLFFGLAFLLSWYPCVIAWARGTTTGPNPLGPFVAALIVSAIATGTAGVKDLLARLVRWRVAPAAYLVAVGLPILLCGLAAVAAMAFAQDPVKIVSPRWQDVVENFIFIFLFIGLGEEPGWRGFALPELLRRFNPVAATLILAAIWTVWHLPLFGSEFPFTIVPAFVVALFGASFVQTWLFRNARESVLLQMIFHATVNTVGSSLVFRWFAPGDVQTLWWINATLWIAVGLMTVVLRRGAPANERVDGGVAALSAQSD